MKKLLMICLLTLGASSVAFAGTGCEVSIKGNLQKGKLKVLVDSLRSKGYQLDADSDPDYTIFANANEADYLIEHPEESEIESVNGVLVEVSRTNHATQTVDFSKRLQEKGPFFETNFTIDIKLKTLLKQALLDLPGCKNL